MTRQGVGEAAELSDAAEAEVRHRCGYGCVRCGVSIYVYARLPITDAPGWQAPATILLCPECFALLRRHPLQPEHYAALLARPVLRDPQFDRQHLPHGAVLPEISAGGNPAIHAVSVPLLCGDQAPLIFAPPNRGLGALRISIALSGADGVMRPVIDANRWHPQEEGWRFAHRGGRYIVESDRSDARAELHCVAPDRLVITHLRTRCDDHDIELTPDWLEVDGERSRNAIMGGQLVGYRI
ncbi:MAG: hypothetical protein AB7E05_11430 [Sphingobium sp.]